MCFYKFSEIITLDYVFKCWFGEKLRAQKLHHNMWTSHLGDENRNQKFPRAQLKKGKIQIKMPVSDRK